MECIPGVLGLVLFRAVPSAVVPTRDVMRGAEIGAVS